jgi:hypothetical protein
MKGDCTGYLSALRDFISQVNAQSGARITTAAASSLVADVQGLLATR